MNDSTPVQFVAIVGGSGSGKGWLVERMCRVLGDKATHLQLDDFYRDRSHLPMARRGHLNFDIPEAIDWAQLEQVLHACRTGRRPDVPRYDFSTYCRESCPQSWQPKPLVFVDGLWLLRSPAIRRQFSLKIYLDAPEELRRSRRFERDVAERGYTREVVEQRYRTAASMHERHVAPQKKWADLVLRQPFDESELNGLANQLWSLLANASLVQTWEHETFRAELAAILANHEYCN
jgi:uridine kinase